MYANAMHGVDLGKQIQSLVICLTPSCCAWGTAGWSEILAHHNGMSHMSPDSENQNETNSDNHLLRVVQYERFKHRWPLDRRFVHPQIGQQTRLMSPLVMLLKPNIRWHRKLFDEAVHFFPPCPSTKNRCVVQCTYDIFVDGDGFVLVTAL